jgi:uncharacterized protein (DUF2147 family)
MLVAASLLLPAIAVADPAASQDAGPIGEWLVAKRVARIRIVNCDQRLWGVVAWEATPGVDSNNPDPSKRSRPTLGMPVLLGMKPAGSNEWKGEIYNAEDGKTYSSSITLLNPDLLKVQGCVLGILCGGENWTRVSAPHAANRAGAPKSAPGTGSASSDNAVCSMLSAGPAH